MRDVVDGSIFCLSVQCFILDLAEGMPKDSLPASSADLVEKPLNRPFGVCGSRKIGLGSRGFERKK